MRLHSVLMAMLLLFTACQSAPQQITGNRIVYGLTLMPTGFDPHINASAELGIPLRQVYDTLIYRHPTTGEFVPGLATEWSISPDGLIYTFTLRQDVRFHDGTPFNAAAVGANLDRIVDGANASQKAIFLLGPYAGYDYVDDYTIRILLSEPYSPLLDSFSQVYLGIASPAALKEYSKNRYQFHQVGTGPFKFIEYNGERILLERNAEYAWGPEFYNAPTENSLEEIEFRFYLDEATRATALESGEVQIMGELSPLDARALTEKADIQITPVNISGQPIQFLINTTRYPTDNLLVRQALLYAANRNAIADAVYQRFAPVAWGPLSANNLFYNRDISGVYAHDTAKAQELLTQAGYSDNDGNGFVDFNGVDLEINVIVPPWGLIPQSVQLLQDHWRTIGVKTTLKTVPTRNALVEEASKNEYNLVAFDTFGIDPNYLNQFFMTDGSSNWSHYANAELDQLLLTATEQTDMVTRLSLYAQAQNLIMNQALILPIRDYVNLNGHHRSIENLSFDAYGWFPLLNNVTIAR